MRDAPIIGAARDAIVGIRPAIVEAVEQMVRLRRELADQPSPAQEAPPGAAPMPDHPAIIGAIVEFFGAARDPIKGIRPAIVESVYGTGGAATVTLAVFVGAGEGIRRSGVLREEEWIRRAALDRNFDAAAFSDRAWPVERGENEA